MQNFLLNVDTRTQTCNYSSSYLKLLRSNFDNI